MPTTNLTTTFQGGNLARQLPNEDHISAIIYDGLGAYPTGGASPLSAKAYYSLDDAEADGITQGSLAFGVLWYHTKEFFRMANEGAKLWLCVFDSTIGVDAGAVILATKGEVRQYGVTSNSINPSEFDSFRAELVARNADAVLVCGVETTTPITAAALVDLRNLGAEYNNLAYLISGDGGNEGAAIADTLGLVFLPALGATLGALSAAKVNQSIGYVRLFNYSEGVDGELDTIATIVAGSTPLTLSEDTLIGGKGYLYFVKRNSRAGTYLNDNPTVAYATSDIAYLSDARVIAKATRQIRVALLPEVNGDVDVDPATGRLTIGYAKFLEGEAAKEFDKMGTAGEISGYSVEVDLNQNVLSSSNIEVLFSIVPKGVSRNILAKVRFALSV